MTSKDKIKKHYKNRLDEIRQQEVLKGQIVLLGDCVIEKINVDEHFTNLHVYNNGISGDTTSLLKETLYKRAIKYKPNKLFLSIGSNDFGFDGADVKSIYNRIIEICEEVELRSKDTQIFLISILPVNASTMEYINREYVDSRDNFDINMLNYYLKNYSRKNGIKFLDATKLLKNNYDMLNLDYTIDGFHLNSNGLAVISQLIRKHV